jgi:hypothetical protein
MSENLGSFEPRLQLLRSLPVRGGPLNTDYCKRSKPSQTIPAQNDTFHMTDREYTFGNNPVTNLAKEGAVRPGGDRKFTWTAADKVANEVMSCNEPVTGPSS